MEMVMLNALYCVMLHLLTRKFSSSLLLQNSDTDELHDS